MLIQHLGDEVLHCLLIPELDHNELFEEDLEGNLTQRVILGAKKVKKLEEE